MAIPEIKKLQNPSDVILPSGITQAQADQIKADVAAGRPVTPTMYANAFGGKPEQAIGKPNVPSIAPAPGQKIQTGNIMEQTTQVPSDVPSGWVKTDQGWLPTGGMMGGVPPVDVGNLHPAIQNMMDAQAAYKLNNIMTQIQQLGQFTPEEIAAMSTADKIATAAKWGSIIANIGQEALTYGGIGAAGGAAIGSVVPGLGTAVGAAAGGIGGAVVGAVKGTITGFTGISKQNKSDAMQSFKNYKSTKNIAMKQLINDINSGIANDPEAIRMKWNAYISDLYLYNSQLKQLNSQNIKYFIDDNGVAKQQEIQTYIETVLPAQTVLLENAMLNPDPKKQLAITDTPDIEAVDAEGNPI